MKNNIKTFLIISLVAVALVVIGIALMNTNKISEQKQQAVETSTSLINKPFPNVMLKDKDGKAYPLESLKGKNVVLFFNEGLMCYPACWNQMAAFGTDARFNSTDTVALSVVVDSSQDWQQAIAKMPDLAKAITLFDVGASVSRQLGILSMGSSMHTGQLPGHTYILIDKQGIVREVFDDPNMGNNNEAILQKISKF